MDSYVEDLKAVLPFAYGAMGIYTATFIASCVLCPVTFYTVHQRQDPARKFVKWLKATFVLFTV